MGVSNNNAAGALVPEELRLDGVRAIGFVDYAFTLNTPLTADTAETRSRVKGKEHEEHFNPEQAAVESYDGNFCLVRGKGASHLLTCLSRKCWK